MRILFLDESGDHNLSIMDINYPVFVLAGSVMDERYHREVLTPRLCELKQKIFGQDDIVLHYVDYTRNQNGFERMKGKDFRENFYKTMNDVIKDTDAGG